MYELPPVEPPNVLVVAPMPKVTIPMFGFIYFVDDVRHTLLFASVKIMHPGTKTYGWRTSGHLSTPTAPRQDAALLSGLRPKFVRGLLPRSKAPQRRNCH
jgi:hypothetical protein